MLYLRVLAVLGSLAGFVFSIVELKEHAKKEKK